MQKILFFNQKQFLIVKKILNHIICFCEKIIVEIKNQMLLYIDDEDETEKFQIIKAIKLEYELLQQKNKVILMTLTDVVSYNIDKCTIHTALCISVKKFIQMKFNSYAYSLWQEKSIMIINEISMMSPTLLNKINQQCNKIQMI